MLRKMALEMTCCCCCCFSCSFNMYDPVGLSIYVFNNYGEFVVNNFNYQIEGS